MRERAIAAVSGVVFCTLLNLAAFAQNINPLKEQVDPNFDPDQRAFYHVRVIEIPKPRWTAYDAKFFGVDMPDEVMITVQDRAYTSPIWYTP
jgi:hypothetical protein